MTLNSTSGTEATWEYGKLRPGRTWVAWALLVGGIAALPLAWLVRDDLAIGRNPLVGWSVLLVGGIVAVIGVASGVMFLRARSRPPKLITVAVGTINLPGGMIIGRRRSLRVAETDVRVIDLGFVRQLQLSSRRTRVTLSSALFSDDAEFDRLVAALKGGE